MNRGGLKGEPLTEPPTTVNCLTLTKTDWARFVSGSILLTDSNFVTDWRDIHDRLPSCKLVLLSWSPRGWFSSSNWFSTSNWFPYNNWPSYYQFIPPCDWFSSRISFNISSIIKFSFDDCFSLLLNGSILFPLPFGHSSELFLQGQCYGASSLLSLLRPASFTARKRATDSLLVNGSVLVAAWSSSSNGSFFNEFLF